jgi:hypothetical protein
MDNRKNNKLSVNKHIFKYGPPIELKSQSRNQRNALYKSSISNSVQDVINKNITAQVNSQVTNFVTSNISNIIEESDIINENITNIVNQNVEIPCDLTVNTLSLCDEGRGKISINTGVHIEGNTIIADGNKFNNLNDISQYGLVTDKPVYIDNTITLDDKILEVKDDNLFFNGNRIKDIDTDEIYNNITPFSVNDNDDTYTFSKVGINTSNPNDYNLTVNGTANITNDITIGGDIYLDEDKIHVQDGELYFNNQLLSCCTYKGKKFYLCYDYNTINFDDLENAIKLELESNNIDTTYINFSFDSSIGVNMTLRTDVCLNAYYEENTIQQIENAYNLVTQGNLTVTVDSVQRTAVPEIYLLNTYYYFSDLSKDNSFKLVKRYDESNSTAILNNYQVFLVNIDGKYLQKNLTFANSGNDNLLLKVHAYTNNFLTENTTCFINQTDGFKLEYLPGMMIHDSCYATNNLDILRASEFGSFYPTRQNCKKTLILGSNFDENTFTQDELWTNIGINPTTITEEIFLSTNIEDYITDPALFDDVYLIDQRWLTIDETNGVVTYGQTYNNNDSNSKKFINGYDFCNTNNIPDYVFHNTYNLESIEEHGNFMFNNKHLPSVKSARYIKNTDDLKKEDILEELEKAHIYIYKMNERLKILENLVI